MVTTNPLRSLWERLDKGIAVVSAETLILNWRDKDPAKLAALNAYIRQRGSYPVGKDYTEQAFWETYRRIEGPELPMSKEPAKC